MLVGNAAKYLLMMKSFQNIKRWFMMRRTFYYSIKLAVTSQLLQDGWIPVKCSKRADIM
jgi:hypothetical protein